MLLVVAVVDHVFPEATLDVNITDPPVQKEVGPPAEIVGIAGKAFTITVIVARGPSTPEVLACAT